MAKATQKVFDVGEISTRKTVMTIGHHLYSLFEAVLVGSIVRDVLVALLRHLILSTQALRAHPERDPSSGPPTPRHSAGHSVIAKYLPMHDDYPLRRCDPRSYMQVTARLERVESACRYTVGRATWLPDWNDRGAANIQAGTSIRHSGRFPDFSSDNIDYSPEFRERRLSANLGFRSQTCMT
jgi:hypothetical protein